MGQNQSTKEDKTVRNEEIIIAQSGNSGGTTTNASISNLSVSDVLGIATFCLVLLIFIYVAYRKYKRCLERKIRNEIRKSQELV